jgi:serine/threonine-protein kinase
LPGAEKGDLCQLSGSTKIMRIIAGIVLAMRYVHSRGIIHRNLTPDNVLLDLNGNVRIWDFGYSVSYNQSQHGAPTNPNGIDSWPDVISHYAAPEMINGITVPESDVFSFGMILYELTVGHLAFSKDIDPRQVGAALLLDCWRPNIPDTIIPVTADLIRDCLALDYRQRPSFTEILQRLELIDFKLIAGVNSVKIESFVIAIENQELCLNRAMVHV